MQLELGSRETGVAMNVSHVMELLDEAYRGESA